MHSVSVFFPLRCAIEKNSASKQAQSDKHSHERSFVRSFVRFFSKCLIKFCVLFENYTLASILIICLLAKSNTTICDDCERRSGGGRGRDNNSMPIDTEYKYLF